MKTYVEVACTYYKTVLVTVEHESDTDEEDIWQLALDAIDDEGGADDTEICKVSRRRPKDHEMALYDEQYEINE